jgi:predicted nucleic acid-binding protein
VYLVDTNVVSELRKSSRCDPAVAVWATTVDPTLQFLSVISVLELQIGVMRVERRDAAAGRLLRQWLDSQVLATFADRTLAIDTAVARVCAGLHVPDPRPERDALIAATALHHGLTLVTRNTRDFEGLGLAVLNPWDALATGPTD